LPSEAWTVTSRPVWRTAWRDGPKRRGSPSSDQMTTATGARCRSGRWGHDSRAGVGRSW
jgi:hypothetical protein